MTTHDAHETSLSKLSEHDWNVLRNHWSQFGGFSFCRKLGRKWTVEGFGISGPLFKTKKAAEAYVSNLICAESRWRAHTSLELTYEQAVTWAKELGIRIRPNDQTAQCWIDRVHQAGITGKQEHIDEANRYAAEREVV